MALDAIIPTPIIDGVTLLDRVTSATQALIRHQKPDGHFVFELEADATIPAEYVLLEHFLDRIDPGLEAASASTCGTSRASMAAGRCSTTGRSIFPQA